MASMVSCVSSRSRIYFSRGSDRDIYKERKSRRDQDRNEPGYYEVPEEIGLCLGALIKSESGEKEEHSDHGISCGNEDIKTGSYEVLRKPWSTCPLGTVM